MLSDQSDQLKKINQISPSFCLAKWLQVTIDLVNGTTHSCHHPQRHIVPLEELKSNPSALHNTNLKKQQRKMMLEGQFPSECSYCWEMEDLGNKYSDRFIKTTDSWAWPDLEKVATMPWKTNIAPKYLEVMIDNICNFSCAYCMADISSSVSAEMKKWGGYPVSNPHHRLPMFQANAKNRHLYYQAFVEWLPSIIDQLKVLRLTGGEPLLSQQFWRLIKDLKHSNAKLDFAVNTHLCHKTETIEKFCNEMSILLKTNKIKHLEIYTSLDGYGSHAEYIRHGLNYQTVLSNIETIKKRLPNTKIIVMCTFNILSIGQFDLFLDDVIILKKKFSLILDVSPLKNPEYLRADIADENLFALVNSSLAKMNLNSSLFNKHEIKKMENIESWMNSNSDQKKQNLRRSDFFKFINEYDRRKDKSFLQIFPEYKNFYILCKKEAFIQVSSFLEKQT